MCHFLIELSAVILLGTLFLQARKFLESITYTCMLWSLVATGVQGQAMGATGLCQVGRIPLATKTHRNDSLKALSNWWNFEKLQAYGKTPTLKCKQLISNKFKIHVDHRKPSAVPVTYSEFSAVHICVSGPLHWLPLALALRMLTAWTLLMSPLSDTTSPNIDRHGEQPIWKPRRRQLSIHQGERGASPSHTLTLTSSLQN